jgi:homocysteine S-methyltransferase
MAKYRHALPQIRGGFFLTDGGIETTLIFLEGQDLPHFAAFHLFRTPEGEGILRKYFRTYAELAQKCRSGLLLETATWRASADWGDKLGYTSDTLAEANKKSVRLLKEIRDEYETPQTPILISGCVGPRGDTMNYAEEAVGLARAARNATLPGVISFTVETDGKLPTGQFLRDAIQQVDDATSGYPAYFMINCAHPSHFSSVVGGDEPWMERIRGLRANASTMSHAELNEAPELDAGNPAELGRDYAALKTQQLKSLNVFGGCCGTDHRHVEQIALACLPLFRGAT